MDPGLVTDEPGEQDVEQLPALPTEHQPLEQRVDRHSRIHVRGKPHLCSTLVGGEVELHHLAHVAKCQRTGTFSVVDARVLEVQLGPFGATGDVPHRIAWLTFGGHPSDRRQHQTVAVGEQQELLPPPGQPGLRLDEGDLPDGTGVHVDLPIRHVPNGVQVEEVVVRPEFLLLPEDLERRCIHRGVAARQEDAVRVLRIDQPLQPAHKPRPQRSVLERR